MFEPTTHSKDSVPLSKRARKSCVVAPGKVSVAGAIAVVCAVVLAGCGGGDAGADAAPAQGTVSLTPPSESATAPVIAPNPPAAGLVALDASTSCGLPGFRDSLLQQINAARAVARTCGNTAMPAAAPLSWDAHLFSAAARHSSDMAVNNYVAHTGQDGSSASQRIEAEGYAWSWAGENIAAGQSSVTSVMNGWLVSTGHCSNIMRSNYVDVAVSCVQRSGSAYGYYWTMELARPRS